MTQDPEWEGETRKIDVEFFTDYLGAELDDYTFLIAVPPSMVEGMQSELDEAGVKEAHVNPAALQWILRSTQLLVGLRLSGPTT